MNTQCILTVFLTLSCSSYASKHTTTPHSVSKALLATGSCAAGTFLATMAYTLHDAPPLLRAVSAASSLAYFYGAVTIMSQKKCKQSSTTLV